MKRIILSICMCCLYFMAVAGIEVPKAVESAFKQKFPKAVSVKWEKENSKEYEANFEMNGIEMSANFAADGKWLETESEIKTSEVPAAIISKVKKEFPNAEVEECTRIERTGNKTFFEVEVKHGSRKTAMTFDPQGNETK